MTNKSRETLTLIILTVIYLLCIVRYFPGRPMDTLMETLSHFLSVGFYGMGLTLVLVSFLKRISGERLPWDRVARLYLTFGLFIEFFCGMYNYFEMTKPPM